VDSGAEVGEMESEELFRACAFSADGRSVANATRDHLAVYEVASGKERVRFKGAAWKLALSRDGRLLASADGSAVRLWDVPRGTAICPLAGHQAHVDALTFAPDGKFLVSASADSTALIWDVARFALPPKPANLDAEQVEALWNDLASEDAGRAFKATVTLGAAPAQTVPWLRKRLKPVATPDAKRIAELIAQLDSDDFAVRNTAAKELEKLGDLAGPALRKALEGAISIEARRRIETLLGAGKPGHALPLEELRRLRAVEVLEQAATADARALLEMLAKGAARARLTREAKAALERLVR
jgi:hypothetical protein